MSDTEYVPSNCHACNGWVIMKVEPVSNGANLICTHCKNIALMEGSKKEIKAFVTNARKVFPLLAAQHPELRKVKNPGDYIVWKRPD